MTHMALQLKVNAFDRLKRDKRPWRSTKDPQKHRHHVAWQNHMRQFSASPNLFLHTHCKDCLSCQIASMSETHGSLKDCIIYIRLHTVEIFVNQSCRPETSEDLICDKCSSNPIQAFGQSRFEVLVNFVSTRVELDDLLQLLKDAIL